jgi:hypothetical protein
MSCSALWMSCRRLGNSESWSHDSLPARWANVRVAGDTATMVYFAAYTMISTMIVVAMTVSNRLGHESCPNRTLPGATTVAYLANR